MGEQLEDPIANELSALFGEQTVTASFAAAGGGCFQPPLLSR